MKRFLVALCIVSIILQLALAPAYAIKYPVEIYTKTLCSNGLSSVDWYKFNNKYGYSYIAWYSVADKKFKIVYPDNNYQEKSYNVTIANGECILGTYKNFIVYVASGTTNTFYKLNIDNGQISVIFTKGTTYGNPSFAMSNEGCIVIGQHSSKAMNICAYDLQSGQILYDKDYPSQLNQYNSKYGIDGLGISVNGQSTGIVETWETGSSTIHTYKNFSCIDSKGIRRGNITTDDYSTSSYRYSSGCITTKTGIMVLDVSEDRDDDEYSSRVYVIMGSTQTTYYYDGELELANMGRYIGSPYCILVGNDDDNAGVLYTNGFTGSDGREYNPDIFYTNYNVIYGSEYRSSIMRFTVDESAKTIGYASIIGDDIIDGEYDAINNRIYVVKFASGGDRRLDIYDNSGSKPQFIGTADYDSVPGIYETQTASITIGSSGIGAFEIRFAEDVIKYVDTVPPVVNVTTNPQSYTSSLQISLNIIAIDNMDSADKLNMCYSLDGGISFSAWEKYSKTKGITLPSGEGNKEIIVKVKDVTGNTGIGTCSIIYGDKSSLPGTISSYSFDVKIGSTSVTSITVDGKKVYPVNSRDIIISTDAKNAVEIKVGMNENSVDEGAYESANIVSGKIQKTINLKDYDGIQAYIIHLRTQYKIESPAIILYFMLDREPPTVEISTVINGQTAATSSSIQLKINAKDNLNGPLYYKINSGAYNALPVNGIITYTGLNKGYNKITITVKDACGNESNDVIEIFRVD